jgi:hypothetical protein
LILYHTRLSTAHVRLGELSEAAQHLKSALSLINSWPYPDIRAVLLMVIAEYLSAAGRPIEAVECAACVMSQPTTWNEVKGQAGVLIEQLVKDLPEAERSGTLERGKTLLPDQLIQSYSNSPIFS